MPQATRRWISEKVKSLNESNVLPFHDILDAKMVNAALASAGVTFKERIYTPFVTLCMFLSQVLDPDHSCRAAVARLIVWLAVNHRKPCSPETNSYCDAAEVPRKVKGALGEAELQGEVYEPIFAKLDGQPKTVRELLANPINRESGPRAAAAGADDPAWAGKVPHNSAEQRRE